MKKEKFGLFKKRKEKIFKINPKVLNTGEEIMGKTKGVLLKTYFSTPEKPVTNRELMEFAKSDINGYTELAKMVADSTGETIEE
jgi:hypothetical protein